MQMSDRNLPSFLTLLLLLYRKPCVLNQSSLPWCKPLCGVHRWGEGKSSPVTDRGYFRGVQAAPCGCGQCVAHFVSTLWIDTTIALKLA